MNEHLMTDKEFDAFLQTWTKGIERTSKAILAFGTHSTGNLMQSIARYVDRMRNGIGRHIAFKFPQYGVFRHYGAGRGWIVVNGVPTRGHRVLSLRELRSHTLNKEARSMMRKGFSRKEVQNAKIKTGGSDIRRPLDWIDGVIAKQQLPLAEASVNFFGDKALAGVLAELDKMKIVKTNKK